jgi:RimJ/RimL family protein N-acetyltransferase
VTLRRYRHADAEALAATITDSREHLRPYLRWIADEPLTLEERRDLIDRWEAEWLDGGDVVLGAFVGDELVGGTGLHRRLGPDALEIGYWVSRRRVRQGIASEMAATLVDVAFSLPEIRQVEIHHDLTNLASEGVPRKLGFADLGERPSNRGEDRAPAECGTDRAWGIDRRRWAEVRR